MLQVIMRGFRNGKPRCNSLLIKRNVVHANPAGADFAPGGAIHGLLGENGHLGAVLQGAYDLVGGTRAAADPQTALGGNGSFVAAGGAVAARGSSGTGIHISHADPALVGAAPGHAVIGELLQNGYAVALGVSTHGIVALAGATADIQTAAGGYSTLGGVGTGGAVLIDIAQADPALAGASPVAALLQDLHPVAVGVTAQTVTVLAGGAADVQLLGGDNAPQLHGGAAVAGDIGGTAAGVSGVAGIVCGVVGAAGVDVVHLDPALVGAAPAILGFQNGDHVTLVIGAHNVTVGAALAADDQTAGGDDALNALGGGAAIGSRLCGSGGSGSVQIAGVGIAVLDIHLYVIHDDPARHGRGDVTPLISHDFLPADDLHTVAGIQVAHNQGVGAG